MTPSSASAPPMPPAGWVLDLDGVVWLGDTPIPGAAAACGRLRASGAPMVFVTNMSRLTVAEQVAKLGRHGIDAAGCVVTSAMAAARCCTPGERVLVVGGAGIVEALHERDVEVLTPSDPGLAVPGRSPVDAVVVGMDPTFDYRALKAATLAIRAGARLIGTNTDPTYPTDEGLLPGSGAILAAVEVASGVRAEVAGKPHGAVTALTRELVGETGMVVGDRADTDGAFAEALGYDFGLVLSGVTSAADLPVEPSPAVVADDLAALVAAMVGAGGDRPA